MRSGHSYFDVDKPRIEIIPMIDIMMFLLVFFMIIALKMITGMGIQLELPGSSTAQDLPPSKITIGVEKDGKMYIEGQVVDEHQLSVKLQEAKLTSKVEVVIAGDKGVSLQNVLKVMDVVRATGITSVGIATRTDSAG